MIEAIKSRLGINPKRSEPLQQRFNADYVGVSPAQLRTSNYPDQYFSGYSIYITDRADMEYRLDISKEGRWGYMRTEAPMVHLSNSVDVLGEVYPAEVQLPKFVDAMTKLCEVLKSKGQLEWVLNAENRIIMDANIAIHPEGEKPKAFSTKDEVADFVETLPEYELTPSGWYCAYFSNMTLQEVLECNFPKSTWPEEVTEQKTFNELSL